eukprot:3740734-Amphidinium_carterae.1
MQKGNTVGKRKQCNQVLRSSLFCSLSDLQSTPAMSVCKAGVFLCASCLGCLDKTTLIKFLANYISQAVGIQTLLWRWLSFSSAFSFPINVFKPHAAALRTHKNNSISPVRSTAISWLRWSSVLKLVRAKASLKCECDAEEVHEHADDQNRHSSGNREVTNRITQRPNPNTISATAHAHECQGRTTMSEYSTQGVRETWLMPHHQNSSTCESTFALGQRWHEASHERQQGQILPLGRDARSTCAYSGPTDRLSQNACLTSDMKSVGLSVCQMCQVILMLIYKQ